MSGAQDSASNAQPKQQSVKVVVRVRPAKQGAEVCAVVGDGTVTIPKPYHDNGSKTYSFDKVFGPEATQSSIFGEVEPIIREVFEGRNATVFAYGQSGAGKTHTMDAHSLTGPASNPTVVLNKENAGITFRAVEFLFEHIRKTGLDAQVFASFMENYNDEVYDLLKNAPGGELQKLRVMSAYQKVVVQNLSENHVQTPEEFERYHITALKNRTTAGTKLNVSSSRSHLMVQLTVRTKVPNSELTAKLCLVDLAGSEDNRYTGNQGDRFGESCHINSSLFALRSVVSALKENKKQIPYRNSKITQLLSDSLGGTANAMAVVCCAPEMENILPTHNSLEFAKDCCFIKNCVEVHETKRKSTGSIDKERESEVPPPKKPNTSVAPLAIPQPAQAAHDPVDMAKLVAPLVLQLLAEKNKASADEENRTPATTTTTGSEQSVERILATMNTGDAKELQKLKFVGPARAKKILKAREDGVFAKPGDLVRAGFSAEMVKTLFQVNMENAIPALDI
ncbi:Kinesin-like protein kif22 [Borealophlyctis nickersoniae]|nr:Kinesin-like protein kif22 [Borealophlyctis nickersoniae]